MDVGSIFGMESVWKPSIWMHRQLLVLVTYLNVTSSYKVDSISGGYELQEVKAALDSIYFVFVTGIGNEINIHCNWIYDPAFKIASVNENKKRASVHFSY